MTNSLLLLLILTLTIVYVSSFVSNANRYLPKSTKIDASQMADEYDVVVVGSGIGGLCTAAMLSKYGFGVAVMESHSRPGGCAHGFKMKAPKVDGTFTFDTGPSFFSGLNPSSTPKASNPLRTVLDAINETVECIPYRTFGLRFPEGDFLHTADFGNSALPLMSPNNNGKDWKKLMARMSPLEAAVNMMPTAALRADVGALLSVGPYLPNFASISPWDTAVLTAPFSDVLDDAGIKDKTTRNWLDLLCFCLSGLPANGTITAEMAMMMGEFYDSDAIMDCPVGGAASIVDALVRGIEKNGGKIFTNAHVEEIVVDDLGKKAVGVRLSQKGGRFVAAKRAVVSNLSVWDMFDKSSTIINQNHFPPSFLRERQDTPACRSFMHLHLGFRASRDELLQWQAHYMCIDDWERGVDAEDNAALVSIPSVHDASLAPEGYAVLHIYTPATEGYERWEGLDRESDAYESLKTQRSQFLWDTLEKIIPDIRSRAVITRVGTPLTHQRYLRRYRGSYGPAIIAGKQSFPFPKTPVRNLLLCGDSCFPGIGVPAVAGSGLLAAHSVSLDSLPQQIKLLYSQRRQQEMSRKS